MPASWNDMNHEGKNLRFIHNRLLRRFKRHSKAEYDEGMIRAADCICTVANTQRRIVDGIKYERRLEDIERILMAIPPEEIAKAKMKIGV